MFVLAAILFVLIGGLNEIWTSWRLIPQAVAGALIATAAELVTGCIVNIWLGWHVWDYSDMPGNLLGQICPQFALLWVLLAAVAIVLDDLIRWRFFDEERPHYRLQEVHMIHLTETKAAIMTGAGVIGGMISQAFGGWDAALITLLIFMAIDYASGLVVAGVFHSSDKSETGALNSIACWQGLLKKGMTLVIVLVAARLDIVLGTAFVRDAVVIAYVVNETISIIENAGLMGLPVPDVIMQAIEQLQGKEQK